MFKISQYFMIPPTSAGSGRTYPYSDIQQKWTFP